MLVLSAKGEAATTGESLAAFCFFLYAPGPPRAPLPSLRFGSVASGCFGFGLGVFDGSFLTRSEASCLVLVERLVPIPLS